MRRPVGIRAGFSEKVLQRVARLAPDEVQSYFERLLSEYGFLDRIVNAVQEGVIVVDAAGIVRYLNQAAAQMFALDLETTLGKSIQQAVRGFDFEELSSGRGIVSREMEVFYPQNRYLNFYMVPLEASADAPDAAPDEAWFGGHAIILRDITESRRSTQETIESERMNALTMLAAGVAHEIGNPLNSLHIHLQLIDRKALKLPVDQRKSIQEMVRVCRDEITRLDFIVNQFLRAIRPSVLETRPCSINEVVLESLSFLEKEIQDRDILVETDFAEALPLVELDRGQIKQAFYNIIRNSFQAMNSGGFLRVTTRLEEDHIVVAFADTGGGISAENMSKLFQPYQTTKEKGSGLGLLIVRRIIREHGGEMALISDEGRGLTVEIRLPLHDRRIRLLKG